MGCPACQEGFLLGRGDRSGEEGLWGVRLPGKGLDGVGGAAGWGLLLLALPRGAGELAGGRGRGRRRWAPSAGPQ